MARTSWRTSGLSRHRGHGLSDLGEPNAVSFQRAVRDVVELTTHLGETPSIVGGISLGAHSPWS